MYKHCDNLAFIPDVSRFAAFLHALCQSVLSSIRIMGR
jgi:hypothetical protein